MRRTLIAISALACLGILSAAARASIISNPVVTASGSVVYFGLGGESFSWPQTSVNIYQTSASVTESDAPLQLTATSYSQVNGDGFNVAKSVLRITFQLADDTPYDLSVTPNLRINTAGPYFTETLYGLLDGTIGYTAVDTSNITRDFQGILPAGTHYLEVKTDTEGPIGNQGSAQVSATLSIVPEPASITLLFLGTLLTLRRPRRSFENLNCNRNSIMQY